MPQPVKQMHVRFNENSLVLTASPFMCLSGMYTYAGAILYFYSPSPWRSCWASGCWSRSEWRWVDSPGPRRSPSEWNPARCRRSLDASPGEECQAKRRKEKRCSTDLSRVGSQRITLTPRVASSNSVFSQCSVCSRKEIISSNTSSNLFGL